MNEGRLQDNFAEPVSQLPWILQEVLETGNVFVVTTEDERANLDCKWWEKGALGFPFYRNVKRDVLLTPSCSSTPCLDLGSWIAGDFSLVVLLVSTR